MGGCRHMSFRKDEQALEEQMGDMIVRVPRCGIIDRCMSQSSLVDEIPTRGFITEFILEDLSLGR